MNNVLVFIKKLHEFAGYRLYLNFIGMLLIGSLEGVGILMLIPMLSLIGVFDSQSNHSFFSAIHNHLMLLPSTWHLPVTLGGFITLMTGQAWLQRQQTVMNARIQEGFVRKLRVELYQAILKADWAFFLKRRNSDFQHVLTSELGRVSMGTHLSLRLATSVLFTFIQVALAFWLSPILTLFILLSGVILFFISRNFIRRSKDQGKRTTELSQSYFAGITDQFNGIKDIKSNTLEPMHLSWFKKLSTNIEENIVALAALQANSQLTYKIAAALLVGAFVLISLMLFQVQAGQLMLILIIFSRLWPRFTGIQSSLGQISVTIPSFRSLMKMQQECESAVEVRGAMPSEADSPLTVRETIECRNVYYRYDYSQERFALRDISIQIQANRMTAIVGKSGAGKSTLIDLLMGLIRPESGEVWIDGILLTEDYLRSLRQSIGYVSQEPFLFHASVRENLLLVRPDATEEQLWDALQFSASEKFVRQLPNGLDTVIGDRGVRLSGGERQRIVLARAILRKPSILVLDEATSALDTENEKYIQEAINRLRGTVTIIVIAHRLSTIRNADQVIVLEDGQVIQQGSLQQLSEEKKGAFGVLWNHQTEINV
ncbi:ABC transporter ATP-binding protein/permease [Paenibacillus sp. TRM 82003]|nr:ABC transporter ATP-binding protein/permease [Paenibacillus sp. TRM 82003]